MPADWLADHLRDDARARLVDAGGGIAGVLPPGTGHAGRFEGLYGGVYDRVIQSDAIRRLAPLAYGDAQPIANLDGVVGRVATQTRARSGRGAPVLLDVPAGGGTLLPRLHRRGYRGRVIAADLGTRMLERAASVAAGVELDVALLRCDAQDLPLRDGAVDGVVSLNGLHVLPDPQRFVAELGRVVRPRGRLWLITIVSGGNRRTDTVVNVGQRVGVLPGPPPTRRTLLRWLADAGFTATAPLGGTGIIGVAASRR